MKNIADKRNNHQMIMFITHIIIGNKKFQLFNNDGHITYRTNRIGEKFFQRSMESKHAQRKRV